MDLTPSHAERQFRDEVRTFLHENLPTGWAGLGGFDEDDRRRFEADWRRRLHSRGYLAVNWPKEYGGAALGGLERVILAEELAQAGLPAGAPNDLLGIGMLGPTLLASGTDGQKRELLPRMLSGEDIWCEGFSEPGAGSDLSNVSCRAVLDGDQWTIDGQKVWTSYAHTATHIFLLARTAPDASARRSITFLLVPMDQAGVEVRRIRNLSGQGEFSEVFFQEAHCKRGDRVGEINDGWSVAMTLLQHERGNLVVTNYAKHRLEIDRLIVMARLSGRSSDPLVRQRIAQCYSAVEVMRHQGLQALTAISRGQTVGAESAMYKLFPTEYHHTVTDLALALLGVRSTTIDGPLPVSVFGPDPDGKADQTGTWIGARYNALAGTIYAGTSQVQRTIIGERLLGLPKEPATR